MSNYSSLLLATPNAKNKNAVAPAAMSTGALPPVNANMNAPANYWQGNNFVIPGYQTAPQTQVPASMLPAANSPLMQNLTPGQQSNLTALTQPQPNPAPMASTSQPQMSGAQNPNIQNLLALMMQGGARNNPSFMPPNIMNMGFK